MFRLAVVGWFWILLELLVLAGFLSFGLLSRGGFSCLWFGFCGFCLCTASFDGIWLW